MAEIKITIPDGQVDRVKTAMLGLYPRPENAELTDNQWAKEVLRKFIIQTVQRWEQKVAMDTARDGVASDEGIAT